MGNKGQKKHFGKKAQVAGQILLYVLAIIVFSMTLLYGYRVVSYFTQRTTEISYLQLENDIKNEIEKVEGDSMGTVKKKVSIIPGNYKHVCFVDSYKGFPIQIEYPNYPLIADHVNSNADDKNMFLAPPGDMSFYIGDIGVDGEFICIAVTGGKVTLRLESMGDHVKISGW